MFYKKVVFFPHLKSVRLKIHSRHTYLLKVTQILVIGQTS